MEAFFILSISNSFYMGISIGNIELQNPLIKAINEASPEGILIVDNKGFIVSHNHRFVEIWQIPSDRLRSYESGTTIGADDAPILSTVLERVQNPKTFLARVQELYDNPHLSDHCEIELRDGRTVERHSTALRSDNGSYLGRIWFFRDITEHKQTEKKLRISSIAFETQEAILVTDANAIIISVNRAFEELTGYSAAEAIGKNPSILQSGQYDAEFYRSMWCTLRESNSWSGEMCDKRKDGTLYPKWLTITAVRNDAGDVTHYVAIFMDLSERKRAEEEIQRLAFFDTLTQLPNRRLLMDRLDQVLAISQRSGSYGALMFLDLDNFKTLNDTQGHGIGDLLLIDVAARLKLCVRESDTVARLGGDEFVVILQELSDSAIHAANLAETVAEKIVSALNEPYLLNNSEHHSSVSVGVCLFHGRDIKLEELLKRADTAMYQAKQGGRNMVRFFELAMQEAVEVRVNLENKLRNALSRQELQLYYQMQVDQEVSITGAEVMLRWFNADLGFVSPAQFIPIAEESGLILPIGAWVLETACQQLHIWAQHAGTRQLILAVNVSVRQFRQPDFVEQVEALLRRFEFNPSSLKLELTESLVQVDINDTIAKMNVLKMLGVRFSMDDFGTGYSSISSLKMLPLDQLKIDKSFIRDIVEDKNDEVIVRTIIDMARNFGLNVIAEGVETKEQLEILRRNGCVNFQGYYFSKPLAVDKIADKLRSGYPEPLVRAQASGGQSSQGTL